MIMVEVSIHDHAPIGNLQVTKILIKLRLNFDPVGTNSAMTHVMVLSAKVRRNEQLWQTLNITNVFGSTFGFINSQYFEE